MEEQLSTQHDEKLESAVIGAVLLEKECLLRIASDFRPELFYNSKHRIIARAIIDLHQENSPIDMLTVTKKIREYSQLETVPAHFISTRTDSVAGTGNLEYHVKLLQQYFLLRETKKICQKSMIRAGENHADGFDLIAGTVSELQKLEAGVITKQFETVDSMHKPFLMDMEALRTGAIPAGINFGLTKMDEKWGGANKTDLIIVAARPGMGKTAFMLKIARNCAFKLNKPCGIFSLEMSNKQLLRRIVSSECEIESSKFRFTKLLTNDDINKARLKEIKDLPLYIDDTPALSIYEFKNRSRKLKNDFGIEMIIIDYLQMMNAGPEYRGNREGEISIISRTLKEMAKELDIPIIALSQLSRSVESRQNKRPILSDLRDSGAIEQDADQVIFLFRPEYYAKDDNEMVTAMINGEEMNMRGKVIIDGAKNRHGNLFTDIFEFDGKYTDFHDVRTF
jgi:replicative DNA helicase